MHAIASSSEPRLRRATPPWPCLRGASTRDVSTRGGPRCRSGSQGEGMQAGRWHRDSADALTAPPRAQKAAAVSQFEDLYV